MTNKHPLDFEKPLVEIEKKIEDIKNSMPDGAPATDELKKLRRKAAKVKKDIFAKLTPYQVTQVARHRDRPYALDYIEAVFDDFVELHGDRLFGDDPAIVGGLARLDGEPVMVIGQQKGRTTKEKLFRNFGMPNPEGYRKALRLMHLAERSKIPVITLIDTPGAYPGIGAEERGQAEAIARNLREMAVLNTPIVSVVIGEGGSGGALALGVADRVMMLTYSTYSVISPEGCAAILYKDAAKADVAAKALKITAPDLAEMGFVDAVIEEPMGGAHTDPDKAARNLKASVLEALADIRTDSLGIVKNRYEKFRKLGSFAEDAE